MLSRKEGGRTFNDKLCGRNRYLNNRNLTKRISDGGKESRINEWPWLVSLQSN